MKLTDATCRALFKHVEGSYYNIFITVDNVHGRFVKGRVNKDGSLAFTLDVEIREKVVVVSRGSGEKILLKMAKDLQSNTRAAIDNYRDMADSLEITCRHLECLIQLRPKKSKAPPKPSKSSKPSVRSAAK